MLALDCRCHIPLQMKSLIISPRTSGVPALHRAASKGSSSSRGSRSQKGCHHTLTALLVFAGSLVSCALGEADRSNAATSSAAHVPRIRSEVDRTMFVQLTLSVTCEPAWRGPCASTDRDRTDRQVHAVVRHPASMAPIPRETHDSRPVHQNAQDQSPRRPTPPSPRDRGASGF